MNINKKIKLNSLITERKQTVQNIDQINKNLPNGNEPVAWRKVVGNVTKHYQYNEIGEGEPLYTHPAKTYEDAIEECAQRAEAYAYMSENFTVLAEELRAILRKAQEK
jgi:hypothetical protein